MRVRSAFAIPLAVLVGTITFSHPAVAAIPFGGLRTSEKAGAQVAPIARVSPTAKCQMVLRNGSRRFVTKPRAFKTGLVQFAWTNARRSPNPLWTAQVRCKTVTGATKLSAQRRFRLTNRASGTMAPSFRRPLALGRAPGVRASDQSGVSVDGKGAGGWSPFGTVLVSGSTWFEGGGVDVYSNGLSGCAFNCTRMTAAGIAYQCVELINRFVLARGWSPRIYGNARDIFANASGANFDKHPLGDGARPAAGDILVWHGGWGGYGHVAIVDWVSGDRVGILEQNASPTGRGVVTISSNYSYGSLAYTGFLHAKANGRPPTVVQNPTPPPSGGGGTPPPSTRAETTGGPTNTWTNYTNAGGTQGPTIPAFTTVQIACKLQGFRVADGNTWWYRIASGPWNSQYYASADAFYNNGATSGSLSGTPFVDAAVPNC